MGLLGWTLSRTPSPRPIVRPRASQGPETDPTVLERLNLVETQVERLQLDQSERQLAVLTAIEKVMHQLRAREAKRVRDEQPEHDELAPPRELARFPEAPTPDGRGATSAGLAARFRRW